MGELVVKETKDGKRYYYVDGVKYPSVTTVLSVIDKSGPLVGWAVRETCDYIEKRLDSDSGYTYTDVIRETIALARKEATRQKREASDIGSQIHDAIHHYNTEGVVPTFSDYRAIKAWEAYMTWVKEHEVTVFMSERVVYDEKWKYAGTMDMGAMITIDGKRKRYLIDVKSSNTFQEVQMGAQVAAYEMTFARNGAAKSEFDGIGVIRLDKETGMPHFYDLTPKMMKHREVFLSALELFNALKALKEKGEE